MLMFVHLVGLYSQVEWECHVCVASFPHTLWILSLAAAQSPASGAGAAYQLHVLHLTLSQ
jgi:hypothetical protein